MRNFPEIVTTEQVQAPAFYVLTETRTKASAPPFVGKKQTITLTNRLEKEVGVYITKNASQRKQQSILEISVGQKGEPFTKAEPSQEPMDVLHEDINVTTPLFIIRSEISILAAIRSLTTHMSSLVVKR